MSARLRIGSGIIAPACLAVAACAPDGAAPVPATQAQLEGAVADASFVGALADGSAICVYHGADGRFLGRSGGLISGTWSVEDGTLCYAYTEGPEMPDCRLAVLNGNRVVLLYDGEVVGQGTFNEGNICA
jgi:hypothetical protein